LWILQTRSAKRTPRAALRIAIDLVHEGLITQQEALRRIDGIDLAALDQTSLVTTGDAVVSGIGASGGIAVGRAAFDSETAQRLAAAGDPVILMRPDTSTADVAGFAIAAGIVTAVGARTAHAALVARQLGKPCIVGCSAMTIDLAADRACLADTTVAGGDWISIDGESGQIYLGRREITVVRPEAELAEIKGWRPGVRGHGQHAPPKSSHHHPAGA
jgi:pyruvate,orthophosphate dikinase